MGNQNKYKSGSIFDMQFITSSISTTLVLLLLGLVVFFVLTAHNLSVYVRENISFSVLISDDMKEADTNYKMNPPLRRKDDVEALKKGLSDGTMEVISTDHAPHTADEKNSSMVKAPFGIVGMETAAALTYTELVLGGYLTPMQMVEKMSYNPAQILHLKKGTLEEGRMADVMLFDPECTYAIDKNKFWSKAKNTPFHSRKVTGKVMMTICDGKIVYDAAEE